MRAILRLSLVTSAILITFVAAQVPLAKNHKYLLLATTRTGTMQKELDQAATAGYRIVAGSPTSGTEMVVLLEKQAADQKPMHYKLLATSNSSTMERELNQEAKTGFRLLPRTMISKPGAFVGIEIICVLERDPNVNKRYQYKLLATTLTSTLQKEIDESIAAGYTLAGMVSRGEHMVIMEKETEGE